jgi:hypothetical protein
MFEQEERVPETQPEGGLQPPVRKPPTAIGARTPDSDDQPVKEVVVPTGTTVKDLSILMNLPTRKIIWAAFNDLGRLVTVNQVLPFAETKAMAAHFGFSARRPTSNEE